MTVLWNVALCCLVESYRRFRGAYCLHHQTLSNPLLYLNPHFRARLINRPDDGGSKHLWMSVNLYQTTRRNIPDNHFLSCAGSVITFSSIQFYHTIVFSVNRGLKSGVQCVCARAWVCVFIPANHPNCCHWSSHCGFCSELSTFRSNEINKAFEVIPQRSGSDRLASALSWWGLWCWSWSLLWNLVTWRKISK
jgi:hypothetical protein